MLAARGFVQGYNAQAAVNEQHVVIAAEISVVNPDFGNSRTGTPRLRGRTGQRRGY